jgi:glucosyl-3-phosphoglycerate synthase
MRIEDWFAQRNYNHEDFADIERLVSAKRAAGLTISVGLPTLNVGSTVGPVVECLRRTLMDEQPLIDQLAIIDSRSEDDTVAHARGAGAEILFDDELLPSMGRARGKGEALWKSLAGLEGDLVFWIDSDIRNIHPRFIYGLAGPLLMDPSLAYIKGYYRRPVATGANEEDQAAGEGGGRVTELMARPALNLFYPELSGFVQPLSGEYGGRREELERVHFFTGYAVETGLLVELLSTVGLEAMGQVDIEERVHANQTLGALSKMSFNILEALFMLLERDGRIELRVPYSPVMQTVARVDHGYHLVPHELEVVARPPIIEVPEYRKLRGLP